MIDPFYGLFDSAADIEHEFREPGCLDGYNVLYAEYKEIEEWGYEWDSRVYLERDRRLYAVNAGHCSCYDLEGQFEPEEVTLDSLRNDIATGWGIGPHSSENSNERILEIIEKNLDALND